MYVAYDANVSQVYMEYCGKAEKRVFDMPDLLPDSLNILLEGYYSRKASLQASL